MKSAFCLKTQPLFNRPPAWLCAAGVSLLLAACGGGSDGKDGTNGLAGTNGVNGLNALALVSSEPAGTNCADGGARIDAGLDANRNGVLATERMDAVSMEGFDAGLSQGFEVAAQEGFRAAG